MKGGTSTSSSGSSVTGTARPGRLPLPVAGLRVAPADGGAPPAVAP
jgi:hypothetical protein